MSPEAPIDDEYQAASARYARDQDLLEKAYSRQQAANGFLGQFIVNRAVNRRARNAYDSDKHLGMIGAIRALREGVPLETVLRETDG